MRGGVQTDPGRGGRAAGRLRRRALVAPLALLRLGRGRPVSDRWGYDRGTPIDRHFIERFLFEHRADVHGRVLEVKSDHYARRFGDGVDSVDVLDVDGRNEAATIVADLAAGDGIPDETFDCFVLTQTLHYIYDVRAALRQTRRILRSGGVLLATVPSVSRVTTELPDLADYWRFTEASCRRLVAEELGDDRAVVRSYGNALTATAFLAGLAAEDLPPTRLDEHDARFPLLVAIRAVKR